MSFFFKTAAIASVPIIFVRVLLGKSTAVTYYVRLTLYLTSLTAVATCAAFIALSMSLVGKRYDVNWVISKMFYGVTSMLLDVHVEIEGEEHLVETKPAIVMMNHQSMLDILFFGKTMQKHSSIMAKKSLRYTPLGPFMSMSGALFIDRGNNVKAVTSLKAAATRMRELSLSLYMYPEGTRHNSQENDLLPFKKGGFHLAIQAGIPIVPVVAENYWRIYHKGVFDTATLRVRALPPIPTEGLTSQDIPTLMNQVRAQMLTALREISPPSPSAASKGHSRVISVSDAPAVSQVLPSANIPKTASGALEVPPWVDPPVSATLRLRKPEETPASGTPTSDGKLSRDSSSINMSDWAASSEGTDTELNPGDAWRRHYEDPDEEDEGMVLVGKPS